MRVRTQRDDCRHSRTPHKYKLKTGLLSPTLAQVAATLAQVVATLAVLALSCATVVSADAPTQVGTPSSTPAPQGIDSLLTTVATTPLSAPGTVIEQQATAAPTSVPGTPVTPTLEATGAPATVPGTPVPTPTPTSQPPTQTPVPPTPTPSPSPSPSPPLPGTSHLAVQVSESVVAVGSTASSEVFVFLRDVQPGISGFHLSLRFDPQIVQVVDADSNAVNGTQVEAAAFFAGQQAGPQQVTENRVDNAAGAIDLTVMQRGSTPVHGTASWHKVATLTWAGRKEGNSMVLVTNASHFVVPGGQKVAPDAAHNGAVFARLPGQVQGTVRLQGREENSSALVTSALAASHVDRVNAGPDGRFVLTASHGEGFYTLVASATGYLSAVGHRPVKLTVDSVVDLGEVTLSGGDANGDNRIDIRDLSYVAWHFDTHDAKADVNGDGRVDILDLSLIAGNFGRAGPTVWQIPG